MSGVRQKLVLALVGLLGLGAAPPVRAEVIREPNNSPEEAFVLPEVRERLRVAQQLELARRLLVDEGSDNPEWVFDWVARSVDSEKRDQLSQLRAQFEASNPTAWRSPYSLDQAADQ